MHVELGHSLDEAVVKATIIKYFAALFEAEMVVLNPIVT
jgi:hypothetical protein